MCILKSLAIFSYIKWDKLDIPKFLQRKKRNNNGGMGKCMVQALLQDRLAGWKPPFPLLFASYRAHLFFNTFSITIISTWHYLFQIALTTSEIAFPFLFFVFLWVHYSHFYWSFICKINTNISILCFKTPREFWLRIKCKNTYLSLWSSSCHTSPLNNLPFIYQWH